MPVLFRWNEVAPTDLLYGSPHNASHGGLSVPVQLASQGAMHRFFHLSPVMRIPFGLKKRESKFGTRFSCDLAFPGVRCDEQGDFVGDEEVLGYLRWLQAIDANNLAKAKEQSLGWFKKDISHDILEEFYFKNIMPASNPQLYSPTFTTRIQTRGDEFVTKFFDRHGLPIEYEDVRAGSMVRVLLETSGLWFANKSFGMSFRVAQLMVMEDNRQFEGCAIPVPSGPTELIAGGACIADFVP